MDSNLFWCIIGIVGGAVFSLLISLFFYFKGLNRKRITYNIKTFCIISNKINQVKGLEVKYNYKNIEDLFSSTITIRNIGNSIIEKDDFAPSYPLSICTNGHFIADDSNGVELLPLNHANNVFPILNTDNNLCNRITIIFDYISKEEEITCHFFHTKDDILLDGILKDGKIISPVLNKTHRKKNKYNKQNNFIFYYNIYVLWSCLTI